MPKSLFRSFAGGEITPEMHGRSELSKFQTGLKTCRNFTVLPHGPAARRPGFRFLLEARDSTRAVSLVPFVFAADQAVMLEFGHQYVRFHTTGGTVLEAAKNITAITQASPGVMTIPAHGWANNDWVYLQGIGGMTGLNGRFVKLAGVTTDTFNMRDAGGAAIDTSDLPAFTSGGTASRVYTLTSPYTSTDLERVIYGQDSDVLTLTHPTRSTRELRRSGATSWAFSVVSFASTTPVPTSVAATPTVAQNENKTIQTYVCTTVEADLVTESVASAEVTALNNLTLAGNYNAITFDPPATGRRIYVYKKRGGVFGYIGQTTTGSLVDDNITPDTTLAPPEVLISTNGGADDYPQAVTHFERRRWFAGTVAKPQTIWATRNGTMSNLSSSIPSRDDDAMEFRIAASQQNAIRHLVPLVDLVALTVGGEFRVFADGGPAISPGTLSIKPQGFSGASTVQPALTESSALYVQAQGSRVRELAYEANGTGRFSSVDASILAPHLFNGYTIKRLAYARAPEPTLWAVRSDGVLLGLTYVPDQQVYGWHQHTTDGVFESVAVIPDGLEDVLFAVVRRVVDGRTVRYIEWLSPRVFTQQADAFFVDSGLTYRGAPADVIGGLWHLEGKAVSVLADGGVIGGLEVADGQITLPYEAAVVHVGLGYVSDLVTLPLAYESAPASGQGAQKNVSDVFLRVTQSSLVKVGPDFEHLTEYPARAVSDPYGSPPELRTGELALSIDPDWNTDGCVCVRQADPLPLTILSMALDTAVSDA